VVFLTAKSEVEDEQRGFDAGAVDYITKPISPPIVLARVHTHLTLKAEHERAEKLLLNVLPAAIAERLKRDATTIADLAEEVTVVFADLVGFTPLAASRSPADIVRLLDDIFTAFDGCAADLNIEKIKTVGDAYVAVAGLPLARADHAPAAARFALCLLEVIRQYNAQHGMALRLRIGIDSGPVVAGVIGKHKFTYDLWGDTVNAAARMESHGEPGRIQLGERAAKLLDREFTLEARGEIDVKGKGPMRTWWLTGERS
jgi:class 3 adenylate cyclase